jgi:electron transport complex protein RnfB
MTADAAGGLAQAIDALLPQTQCRRCGFDGCLPYATALARQETELNRCPPGGAPVIERLAALLGRPALPLDSACGSESPPQVAWIDEPACIGCALSRRLPDGRDHQRPQAHAHGHRRDCSGCDWRLPIVQSTAS